MGLAERQRLLARLYTNTGLRERFFARPAEVGRELGLSEREAEDLARLERERVDLFAASLQGKRLSEVAKLLPLTRRALGDRFEREFRRFAETFNPTEVKKHLEDALAFAAHLLCGPLAGAGGAPAWQRDLLRYEEAWLRSARPARYFEVLFSFYDLPELIARLNQAAPARRPRLRPTLALWCRTSPDREVTHFMRSLTGG